MDASGSVKLADFGLAKVFPPFLCHDLSLFVNNFQNGYLSFCPNINIVINFQATKFNDLLSCKGTPFWMAPEVFCYPLS